MSIIDKVNIPEGVSGAWAVKKFTVSKEEAVFSSIRALVYPREYVPEGEYTKLQHASRGIIMSDTPTEMRDHRSFVYYAQGNVLINGLGLGMVLGALLKPDRNRVVDKVTVIEISPDVISLVAPHYQDSRVEIIRADAFEYKPPKGVRYDYVWHDIWDNVCADNVEQMTKLKRKYGRRADWQGCWAEHECRKRR